MKYVLDTNIVARLLDADERVLARLTDVEPSDVGIPKPVYAEPLFGAERSSRREENLARIDADSALDCRLCIGRKRAMALASLLKASARRRFFDAEKR